jgi:predicted Zn-dependent protease
MASGDDLYIDAEEFYDAPADILMFVLAHEMAHIIFDHTWVRDPKAPPLTVQQEQQQELDADKFALEIMKKIGINKIKVWTWLRRKKNDLEEYKRRQEAAAPLGHPTFNQRTDQARTMGVELTQANTDQIDQAIQQLQHMA